MFNEAFWFFYWINVVGNISFFLGAIAILSLLALTLSVGFIFIEEDAKAKKLAKILVAVFLLCGLGSSLMPPEDAFYAGATQYVAEAVELDDTLVSLKNLVDEKIEELSSAEDER